MKTLNLSFEDKNYNEILKSKEIHGGNWHDFILDLSRLYKKEQIAK